MYVALITSHLPPSCCKLLKLWPLVERNMAAICRYFNQLEIPHVIRRNHCSPSCRSYHQLSEHSAQLQVSFMASVIDKVFRPHQTNCSHIKHMHGPNPALKKIFSQFIIYCNNVLFFSSSFI